MLDEGVRLSKIARDLDCSWDLISSVRKLKEAGKSLAAPSRKARGKGARRRPAPPKSQDDPDYSPRGKCPEAGDCGEEEEEQAGATEGKKVAPGNYCSAKYCTNCQGREGLRGVKFYREGSLGSQSSVSKLLLRECMGHLISMPRNLWDSKYYETKKY